MIRVFGTAAIDDAAALAGRDRQVLAALVVTSGHPCPADRLADALYGASPPATWRKVIQGSIVRLRRVLGARAIETIGDGYRLALGSDHVDVRRFERLVERARELAATGDTERAVGTLEEALALARDEPFTELQGWDPARAEAARIHELRLHAEDALVDGLLGTGRTREAVATAAAAVEREPLREERWAALALAQYRAGRQGDALRSIQRARRVLAHELGLDPGPGLQELERAILAQEPDLVTGPDRHPPSAACPYRGLAGYDVDDAEEFFGRDAAVHECLTRLAATGFVAVVGPSGSGKSSLVRAGVAPNYAREGAGVAVVTPGRHPKAAIADTPPASLLVVDQLEELFTQCDDAEERSAFVEALEARAVTELVVVALRSDHLGSVTELPELATRIELGLYLLRPMSSDDLRAAIEGPARRAGVLLESGLVELLLHDVEGQPGALPLLSHALTEAWARRDGRVLTAEAYEAAGGVQGAVSQTAERAIEALPVRGRRVARELFLRLVLTSDGTLARRRLDVADLAVDEDHASVLDALVRARLVTLDGQTVQIAHEALAVAWPRLRGWLDEDQEGQRIRQHLVGAAADWAGLGHDESELYRGGRLRTAEDWVAASHPTLTSTERAFLDASIAARREVEDDAAARARDQWRANRRLRRSFAALCVVLAIALIATGAAVVQGRRVTDERDRAQTNARETAMTNLLARAEALRSTKQDLAALLAVAAYRSDPGIDTYSALLGVPTAAPELLRTIPLAERARSGVLLADGRTYAVTDEGQGVRLVDLDSGDVIRSFPPVQGGGESVGYLARTNDGSALALVSFARTGGDSKLTMWDLPTGDRRFADVGLPFDATSLSFSPDDRLLAVSGGNEGAAEVRRTTDGSLVAAVPGLSLADDAADAAGWTGALTFLPDGTLAVTSRTGPLRIVDPNTGAELRRIDAPEESAGVAVASSSDGSTVFGSSIDGTVAWNLDAGTLRWHATHTRDCSTLVVAERIPALLCGRIDGTVRALDLATGEALPHRFDYQYGNVETLTLADDGRTLIEAGGTSIVLWGLDGAGAAAAVVDDSANLHPSGFDARGTLWVSHLSPTGALSQVGQRLVDAGSARIVDRLDEVVAAAPGPPQHPTWIVALFADGGGGILDTETRRRLPWSIAPGASLPTRGVWAGPEMVIFASEHEMWARDWSGQLTGPTVHIDDEIYGFWVNADHGLLFTRGPNGVVQRDLATFEPTGRPAIGRGVSTALALGGDLIAVSTEDGQVALHDVVTLEPDPRQLPPTPGVVNWLRLSEDGSRLLVVNHDRTARLADVRSASYLGSPIDLGPEGAIRRGFSRDGRGALSADGETMALASSQGVVIWRLDPDHLVAAACQIAGREITRAEWRDHLAFLGDYDPVCPEANPTH